MSTSAPPDNINPSYIVVNPDGTISAQFSGVIFAAGVTLPIATVAGSTDAEIQWSAPPGSVEQFLADILASAIPNSSNTLIGVEIRAAQVGQDSDAFLQAEDANGNTLAWIQIHQAGIGPLGNGGPDFIKMGAGGSVPAGGQRVTVIDSQGESSFLKNVLTDVMDMQYQVGAFGSFTVAVPAGESTITLALNNPWPNNHFAFFGTANPASSASSGNFVQDSSPSGLAHGNIQVVSSIAQNMRCSYLSFGN